MRACLLHRDSCYATPFEGWPQESSMNSSPWLADRSHTPLQTEHTPTSEDERLLHALFHAVIPPGGTPRCALMNGPDRDRKYSDPPRGHTFSLDDLRAHLRTPGTHGARTWAVVLRNTAGEAVAGCRDYDGDDSQGAITGLAALAAATAAGLTAFALFVNGRAHVWVLYRLPAPAADIAHQLRTILPSGPGEIYPSGNNIRLPLGFHCHHRTRGTLVLPDGHLIPLDTPTGLSAGLSAILSLRRNLAPPPAPASAASSPASSATPTDPACWDHLPDGKALMDTPRYKALFTRRPQLRLLAAGKRVTLNTSAGPKDTGSEQVAVLIANLLTTGLASAPGRGAPPLAEIRAVALHWHPTLRPDYPLPAYKADIDRLIAKYTPPLYDPEPTRILSLRHISPSPARTPARCRRAGDRATQADTLASLLTSHINHVVTIADLARALSVRPRMIGLYLRDLRIAGRLDTTRSGHGLRIIRVGEPHTMIEKPSCPQRKKPPSPAPSEGAEPIGNRAESETLTDGITEPKNEELARMQEVHTRPACGAVVESAPPSAALPGLSGGAAAPQGEEATAGAEPIGNRAESETLTDGITEPKNEELARMQEEHTAPALGGADESASAPPRRSLAGADLLVADMAALAAKLVVIHGDSWARVKQAACLRHGIGGRGDRARVDALRTGYDVVVVVLRAEQKRQTRLRQQVVRAAHWVAEEERIASLSLRALYASEASLQRLVDRAAAAPPLSWESLTEEDREVLVEAARWRHDTREEREHLAQERHAARIVAHRKDRRAAPWATSQLRLLRREIQCRESDDPPPVSHRDGGTLSKGHRCPA